MPTTNRGYETPITGSLVGTWGSAALNPNFEKIDQNLGGVVTIALTNANVTLNATQAANGTIRFTGVLTGNVVITLPSVQGWWVIDNQTTGAFYVQLTCGGGNRIAIEQGGAWDIFTDGSNVGFRNLPPVGTYLDDAGATVPLWISACTVPPYLLCDGSTFNATTYPRLNAKLGGNTLPDVRNRARVSLGGGRLTTAGSGIDGNVRFASGGVQSVTLTIAQIPVHNHSITDPGHIHTGTTTANRIDSGFGIGGGGGFELKAPTVTINSNTTGITGTNNAGSGALHNNVQPTIVAGITMIRAA